MGMILIFDVDKIHTILHIRPDIIEERNLVWKNNYYIIYVKTVDVDVWKLMKVLMVRKIFVVIQRTIKFMNVQ